MKIILTGSTGEIGTAVLHQSITSPAITSIIVLSRRALPSSHTTSPKVQVILIEDFTSYSASTIQQLSGAEACIWALGGIPSKYPDLATAKKVNIDFPVAAAKVFSRTLASRLPAGKKFNFVYLSGHAADGDLTKKHRWFNDAIHIKNELEKQVTAIEQSNKDQFSSFSARVGSVIPTNSRVIALIVGLTISLYPAMKVEELAAALVDIALNGSEMHLVTHDELVAKGKAVSARAE